VVDERSLSMSALQHGFLRRVARCVAHETSGRFLVLVAAIAAVAPLVGCGGRRQIAFVDVQRALNETREGRAAKEQIKAFFGERQRDLDKRQDLLRSMESRIKGEEANANAEAYAHQVEVLRTAFADLQLTYQAYQSEIQQREAEAVAQILKKMKGVLAEIAHRERYKAILEINEGGAFYRDEELDLTDELIKLYDERY
jgi:outer membrane protein